MKGVNKLKAEIIKMLPDEWNYQDRLKFFEQLADIYRKKSRESVYRDKVILKTDEGYRQGGKG